MDHLPYAWISMFSIFVYVPPATVFGMKLQETLYFQENDLRYVEVFSVFERSLRILFVMVPIVIDTPWLRCLLGTLCLGTLLYVNVVTSPAADFQRLSPKTLRRFVVSPTSTSTYPASTGSPRGDQNEPKTKNSEFGLGENSSMGICFVFSGPAAFHKSISVRVSPVIKSQANMPV